MIAADTSSLVAYFSGNDGTDVEKLAAAISSGELVLPAVVVTETLSDPASARLLDAEIPDLATLPSPTVIGSVRATLAVFSRRVASRRKSATPSSLNHASITTSR